MFIYIHYVPKVVIAGADSGDKLPLSVKYFCGISQIAFDNYIQLQVREWAKVDNWHLHNQLLNNLGR